MLFIINISSIKFTKGEFIEESNNLNDTYVRIFLFHKTL